MLIEGARLILLLIMVFCCKGTFTQTLVNSTGNTIQNNAISVEYSIGEIGITTLPGTANYITQGFFQPIFYFKDCNLLRLIPTAFTPNNDHLNDCFGAKRWPLTSSFELNVYNRAGQMLFRSTNITECWDGTFNGIAQPMGTYIYSVKATTDVCGQITKKGTIVLIR